MSSQAIEALSAGLADAVERASRAVVAVHARHRVPSSGTVWQPGVVVTAAHTVKRDEEITVTTPDGRTLPATLAGRDTSTDLAVLRVDEQLAAAERGDGDVLPPELERARGGRCRVRLRAGRRDPARRRLGRVVTRNS